MKKTVIMIYDKATIGGGASKIAVQSALELTRNQDIKVIFFAANGDISPELENCESIEVFCINTPLIADNKNKLAACMYGIWNNDAKKILEEVLRKLDPANTIIHIHGWTKALSTSIIACARKRKFPILITLHDYFAVCPNGGFYNYNSQKICNLKPMSLRCIACNCDKRSYAQKVWRCIRQIVQNKYVANASELNYVYISNRILKLTKPYLKSEKFFYLRNPIDLADRMSLEHHKSNVFIYAGRVSEEKGVEGFCKAITVLQESHPIKGQVIGTGPLYETLKASYPNIEFVGWVNGCEIIDYYEKARALVFPSICNEGSPLTIPEALSAGLPCIVSDCTSATETIVDGKNGFIYKAGDVANLIEKIKVALDDKVIDECQKEIKRTFNCVEYSYQRYGRESDAIYEEILDRRACL